MRGLLLLVLVCGAVAVLIPWPWLLPGSLVLLALVWIATPLERDVQPAAEDAGEPREERDLSDSR